MKWLIVIVLFLLEMLLVAFVWTRWYVLDTPECWFPKREVPYHDGMTICPGQSAIMVVPLHIEAKRKDI